MKIKDYKNGDLLNGIIFKKHLSFGSNRMAIFECPICRKDWKTRFCRVKSGNAKKCKSCSSKITGQKVGKLGLSTSNWGAKKRAVMLIKKNAIDRKKSFNLTLEYALNIITQNCHYCNDEPTQIKNTTINFIPFYHNGIDRKNNDIGYEIGNCLPCCVKCNVAKSTMTYEDFKNLINKIYNNLNK